MKRHFSLCILVLCCVSFCYVCMLSTESYQGTPVVERKLKKASQFETAERFKATLRPRREKLATCDRNVPPHNVCGCLWVLRTVHWSVFLYKSRGQGVVVIITYTAASVESEIRWESSRHF